MHDLKSKIRSKAFAGGLLDGFAAPVTFYMPVCRIRHIDCDMNVENAWLEVGKALKLAESTERGNFVKSTRKAVKQTRAA